MVRLSSSKPSRLSQHLAWITLLGVVAVMLAPFRGMPMRGEPTTRTAGVVPLMAASSLADAGSFHRQSFQTPVAVCDESQFRLPTVEKKRLESRREIVVAKRVTPLEVDFQAPRVGWQHLDAGDRRALDALSEGGQSQELVLHGSGSAVGDLERIEAMQRRLNWGRQSHEALVVLGNGSLSGDGEIEVRQGSGAGGPVTSLAVQLVGDFHAAGPTRAQLEALDELVDYLSVRVGPVTVRGHAPLGAGPAHRGGGGCLGPLFPLHLVMMACGSGDP